MTFLDHLKRMAAYNAWMNASVYAHAAALPAAVLSRPSGAFFGSILGTLNHLVVADIMWLRRFANHPGLAAALGDLGDLPPVSRLDEIVVADLEPLTALRRRVDECITRLIDGLPADFDFDAALSYRRANGTPQQKPIGLLLDHLFNHQTHHRGQASTLFHQAGVDIGVTDLQAMVPSSL